MASQIDDMKKQRLVSTLKRVGGNRTAAALKLGVSVRTVRNWIKRFELENAFPPARGRQAT